MPCLYYKSASCDHHIWLRYNICLRCYVHVVVQVESERRVRALAEEQAALARKAEQEEGQRLVVAAAAQAKALELQVEETRDNISRGIVVYVKYCVL